MPKGFIKVKIMGVTFSVPNFINFRGKRYAESTTHSFMKNARNAAKSLKEKGFSTVIKSQSGLSASGKRVKAFTVFLRKRKK